MAVREKLVDRTVVDREAMPRQHAQGADLGGEGDPAARPGDPGLLEDLEALNSVGQPSPLDHVRRIIVFIVNGHATWQNVLWAVGIALVLWIVVDILAAAARSDRVVGDRRE